MRPARESDETGMQLDPMQARLDELLRRLESQESLNRTLQATQVPLNEDPQENCLVDDRKQQNHSNNLTMRGGTGMICGLSKAGAKAGTIGRMRPWSNTKPTNNPTTVPTWNGDAKLFDDHEFDVLMYKRGSNPGDHCFLVPRLISGLTGRAREHLRMAGDLDRFAC